MKKYLSIGFISMLVLGGFSFANKASAETVPPTIGAVSVAPFVINGGITYISNLSTISASATDSGSGINTTSCRYSINNGGGSWTIVASAYNGTNCVFTSVDTTLATGGIGVNAVDVDGNFGVSSWLRNFAVDNTAPVIAIHDKIDVEATSSAGAVVDYTAPDATDNVDATAPATCLPASGSTFPMGITTINCNKTDVLGNVATPTSFQIKVEDTTAPVITLLGDSVVNVPLNGVYVDAGATALDNIDGDITGSIFVTNHVDTSIAGTYLVTYNVNDAAHNTAIEVTRTVVVFVQGSGPLLTSIPPATSPVTAPVTLTITPVPVVNGNDNSGNGNNGQVLGDTSFKFTRTLKRGMKGDDVLELHKKLLALGFYSGSVDDTFGLLLQAAVKAFQKANSPLKIDGIVGPATIELLNK